MQLHSTLLSIQLDIILQNLIKGHLKMQGVDNFIYL